MNGIWAAVLTPVDGGYVPDPGCAAPYYAELLNSGCDGLNVLGTTGEAMSFSAGQRIRFMEALRSSGLPAERLMVGTGAASLRDAVALTRCAFELGLAAALVMPPFFFREASDDGIVAFFDALFSQTNPPGKRVLLYNFPRMSGIAFHPALICRLLDEFPEVIAGIKDSSNDPLLQSEIIARRPELRIFPGSERDLAAAKARGTAGCISGSVALWPQLARTVFEEGGEKAAAELASNRAALDAFPFIPAVRYLTAVRLRSARWENPMPPQQPLALEQRQALEQLA